MGVSEFAKQLVYLLQLTPDSKSLTTDARQLFERLLKDLLKPLNSVTHSVYGTLNSPSSAIDDGIQSAKRCHRVRARRAKTPDEHRTGRDDNKLIEQVWICPEK